MVVKRYVACKWVVHWFWFAGCMGRCMGKGVWLSCILHSASGMKAKPFLMAVVLLITTHAKLISVKWEQNKRSAVQLPLDHVLLLALSPGPRGLGTRVKAQRERPRGEASVAF